MNNSDIINGVDLAMSAASAFLLISQPEKLRRWFAEEVDIELAVGGKFVFAGNGAYVPTSTKLTGFAPGALISWHWPLHGVIGEVTLTAVPKENADACRVEARCSFPVLPPLLRARELIDDVWRFHLGNLKTLSEGGKGVILPDFSNPAPEVRQTIFIEAARAQVFQALLAPALLAKWTYGTPVVEPRAGGRYSYGWTYDYDGQQVLGGPTRILELVENERLVTDWPDWRGDASNNGQKITWLLEDCGAGTNLTLIHDGFVRAADISDFPFGWSGFLEMIRDVCLG